MYIIIIINAKATIKSDLHFSGNRKQKTDRYRLTDRQKERKVKQRMTNRQTEQKDRHTDRRNDKQQEQNSQKRKLQRQTIHKFLRDSSKDRDSSKCGQKPTFNNMVMVDRPILNH